MQNLWFLASRPKHLSLSYLNSSSSRALPLTGVPSDRLQPVGSVPVVAVLVPQAANPTAIRPSNSTVLMTRHLAAKSYADTDRRVVFVVDQRNCSMVPLALASCEAYGAADLSHQASRDLPLS